MRKIFFVFLTLVVILFMTGCGKTNPIWGLWVQTPKIGPKTEIMFTDDNTGFVFVEDTVKYETKWKQDSLLYVDYFETLSTEKVAAESKFYKVTIDEGNMKLEDIKTGKVTSYSRYVEK